MSAGAVRIVHVGNDGNAGLRQRASESAASDSGRKRYEGGPVFIEYYLKWFSKK